MTSNDLGNSLQLFVYNFLLQDEAASVMSFTSSVHSLNNDPNRGDLETKIECVDSMVAMLGRYVSIGASQLFVCNLSAVCLHFLQH